MSKMFEKEDLFNDIHEKAIRNHHQAVFLYNLVDDLIKERDGEKSLLLPKSKLSAVMQETVVLYLLHLEKEDREEVLAMWKSLMKEKEDALQNSNP